MADPALRIAVLVKQIPLVADMRLGADGRLVRSGDAASVEMSAYCRRAVSKAVALAAAAPGSTVTVVTLGPPPAADVLREAVVWGLDRDVDVRGVLLSDPAFAGSDTIATARALAALLRREGPFDLVLTGRNSLDADTGQVPPQVAELLDLPFATGVKELARDGATLRLGCEHDDSWVDLELDLPAVLSCAERSCDPAKVPADRRAAAPAERVATVGAADLGPGPWGADGSLTTVGPCRTIAVDRERRRSPDSPLDAQVSDLVKLLVDRGALAAESAADLPPVPATGGAGPVVGVVAEPGQDALTRELCGLAARLAATLGGSVTVLAPHGLPADVAGGWGADRLVRAEGADVEEDLAGAVTAWARAAAPWAILAGSTAYGREVASRAAAALGAGLTGDAVEVGVEDGRLVAWKPAFGGQLVAAITAVSPVQMATVRAGVVPAAPPRDGVVAAVESLPVEPRGRVRVQGRRREDALEELGDADVVIGIGAGVGPGEAHELEELRALLGAEIGCTRKLTDNGRMPHARQIGITGRTLAPRLYVAIGLGGKLNHMAGVRAAGTVVAINPDPDAPVWEFSDAGVVGSWREAVPLLAEALTEALRAEPGR